MLRRVLMLTTIAVVLTVAGCGGDSDSESSAPAATSGDGSGSVATSSLAKNQFIEQAEELCKREKKGLLQKAGSYIEKHSSEGLAPPVLTANGVKEVVLPVVEAQIEVVRKLGAPAGDEEEIEAMLDAQRQAVEGVKEQETLDPVYGAGEFFKEADKMYKRYGLGECSYDL